MNTIELNFKWIFDLPSVAVLQFQTDLERLSDDSGDLSEFPSFFIDLKTGELLMIGDEIAGGNAYQYENSTNWLIEGKGWWIGYSESEMDYLVNLPDMSVKDKLLDIFEPEKQNNFNDIVSKVCDMARGNKLKALNNVTGLYPKLINNDDAPSLG